MMKVPIKTEDTDHMYRVKDRPAAFIWIMQSSLWNREMHITASVIKKDWIL